MDSNILLTGIFIFLARICDVSVGTVRTIVTVQGRMVVAFCLGLIEITVWIYVASTVMLQLKDSPILVAFYALGFATGNVVGIFVERKLAFGLIVLRVITSKAGNTIAERLREMGQPVTVFIGEGMLGPVLELYIVCRRRDLNLILQVVLEEDESAFYITEQARDVSKILRPFAQQQTGWHAVFKKK